MSISFETALAATRRAKVASGQGCTHIRRIRRSRAVRKLLKPDGVFVGVGNARQAFGALLKSLTSKHFSVIMGPKDKQPDYLSYAKELAESGNLVPYVDRVYPVAEAADAIRYLLTAHAQGKVVLRMSF